MFALVFARVALIGVGATFILDMWIALLRRAGVQTTDMGLIGRWMWHVLRGQLFQPSIRNKPPVPGEVTLGWLTHYAIGTLFASLLLLVTGTHWLYAPASLPAIFVGMGTVVAPLFVMQPLMGAGFVASKTPTPVSNCLRSLINHTVFGVGMYVSAVIVNILSR